MPSTLLPERGGQGLVRLLLFPVTSAVTIILSQHIGFSLFSVLYVILIKITAFA